MNNENINLRFHITFENEKGGLSVVKPTYQDIQSGLYDEKEIIILTIYAMTLTENATRVYLGTDMGDMARKMEFDRFHSAWCAKIMMLSISKKEEDKKTYEAMKAINSSEFYYDANRD